MEAGTRSEVKAFIKKGRVTVNGETAKSPEQKVDETKDTVTLDGHSFSYQKYFYYMLHKPAGVVTAVRDHHDQTVLDLLVDAPGKGSSGRCGIKSGHSAGNCPIYSSEGGHASYHDR